MIAQVEQATDTVTYLHADALGSVRASTDAAGVLLGAQSFTEFGTVLWAVGVIGTRFGFTGNWTDPDTGLLHLRARDYDPTTGQFLSVDPALDDTRQPYAYAGNNPIQFTDHTGLDFWADLGTNTLAFGAGLLNGATFGLSGLIMSAVIPGYDCFVETNSGFYTAGDIIGMTATTIAVSAISAGSLGALGVGLRVTTTAATKVLPAAIRTSQQTVVATTRIAANTGHVAGPARNTDLVLDSFQGLGKGRNAHVRTVGSVDELQDTFNTWSVGAERLAARGPKVPDVYRLPDSGIIQWRTSSATGGPSIDIFPVSGRQRTVHLTDGVPW